MILKIIDVASSFSMAQNADAYKLAVGFFSLRINIVRESVSSLE